MTRPTDNPSLAVARAWRDAWTANEVGDDPPAICEGCSHPATTVDSSDEQVPLCDECARVCADEWADEAADLLREIARGLDYSAPEVLADIERRARALVGGDR